MKKLSVLLLLLNILLFSNKSRAQNNTDDQKYIYKTGDYNGIGKWYMDREIAYVMGYEGIGWLERSQREKEENVSKLIQNMGIKSNDTIADIGAGSGYHVFRIAPIANKGMVYAVDIQTEMLMAIENIKETSKIKNIKTILSSEQSVYLAENSVDKILMVDVYHEFSFPIEMITSIKSALKPKGELFLIEYRAEDPNVPIKRIHKMSEKQAVKEMEAAGFKLKRNINNLPWQHCMVFIKN
ncbi:class I SAM-dependent methyltransferase [Flavobacteriaceae bacterium]|jgi:SAM-dependent methyltransferase|nr:class I SAM-dependent methyltransferase [Flavobacteriaceae bacterium]MDA9067593.1 class I SAM-dependent methyltransferase [Flavobacteriaceae bacterium]MDB4134816.1 class I SAM-dependent methyltransferase [Flavobacteriaceae bacterium]